MRYWKGLLIAVAFDAAYLGTGRLGEMGQAPRAHSFATIAARVARDTGPSIAELEALGAREDSLIGAIQADSSDVLAMGTLARMYLEHGWPARAIGPLARARQLAPDHAELDTALDEAIERSGEDLTDGDLAAAAREFVDIVAMWGHGC